MVEELRADLERVRHPSDGGGRAWISKAEPETVRAGERGRWRIEYEVGPEGISVGGTVFLQVSPYWGWSTPQNLEPSAPGYTVVKTDADGVTLEVTTVDQQLMAIRIAGRGLEPGERLTVDYGAGVAGATADRFAESESRFWIAVDGDGDGIRGLLADSPTIVVVAGLARRLLLLVPSTAKPGDVLQLRAVALDSAGNAGAEIDDTCDLQAQPGLEMPASFALHTDSGSFATVQFTSSDEGIVRLRAQCSTGLEAESNPLMVLTEDLPILWGDLHGHSALSDGTGTPEDYFSYARDIAALDVVALTDHDHYGLRFLSQSPDLWQEIVENVEAFHEPPALVTVLGYEWTNWTYGHRHVLYFDDSQDLLSAVDPRYDSPPELWDALRGRQALTFAHHSAGGPVAVDWSIPPDPVLEPLTEIVSAHGSSEASDSPHRIYSPLAGNFVRDVLNQGYRLGFVGSGDGHDGHPGLTHLSYPTGGLAAILTGNRTRLGILEALRARRVYATNGPRIILRASLDGHRMGSTLPAPGTGTLRFLVISEQPIERIDLIRRDRPILQITGDGSRLASFENSIDGLERGGYLYVRVVQTDGGAAWSSPFFFE
ncbi:MAG: CehA/McbA family metallohydrolase [Planctomycetota bacterium]|nr:CehA/McbA family metallohydrolase [Planctomycetota bacterium]